MSFWEFLSGKKTVFGAILLLVVQLVPPDTTLFGFLNLAEALTWLGNILAGVGLAHKGAKAVANK